MINKVKSLPAEWTVLQITKRHNGRAFVSLFNQIVSRDTGYFITLLRYPRMALNGNRPILISVEPEESSSYGDLYKILSSLRSDLKFDKDNDTKEARKLYWEKLKQNDEKLAATIGALNEMFAPWIFLFTGEFADSLSAKHEAVIFKKIDEFAVRHKCTLENRILLSLIGRRIDLMQPEAIYRACVYLENGDMEKVKETFLFLSKLKENFALSAFEFPLPCLLIVDELMDHIFWEMQNIDQGFCRLSSLDILMRLFENHKDSVKNGYLEVYITTGTAVINPESNLPVMEKRITQFAEQCLPKDFNLIVGKKPEKEEISKALGTDDIFLYFGHGNGLQFTKGDFLATSHIKSVAFLFGCGSVQLNSSGMWAEMKGAHIYYHVALW